MLRCTPTQSLRTCSNHLQQLLDTLQELASWEDTSQVGECKGTCMNSSCRKHRGECRPSLHEFLFPSRALAGEGKRCRFRHIRASYSLN
eukprot:scaffold11492_cov20-Tisochrysis_lutea.AAC.2